MARLFKSLQNICDSTSKKSFVLSLLAVASWIIAVNVAVFSDQLAFVNTGMLTTLLLAVSALFSLTAIPRMTHTEPAAQPAPDAQELHEH